MTNGTDHDSEVEASFPASDPPSHAAVPGVGGPLYSASALDEAARLRAQPASPSHRVVVIGGGFGGLAAVRALAGAPVDVTLIDRSNHHLFQPLLYQVATGALSPANIAVPLRSILRHQANARVLLAEVRALDIERREVLLDGQAVPYDSLIVAAGSASHWFGHETWQDRAPGLKSLAEATAHRAMILRAFEEAELRARSGTGTVPLRFVVIGGGPTGVEMAGAIAELARDTLRRDFRSIDTRSAEVVLIEAAAQILPSYPAGLAARAQAALERLGVRVLTGAAVSDIDDEGVTCRRDGEDFRIDSRTVIWAAGVRAASLASVVCEAAGLTPDRSGRVPVRPDLTVEAHPEVSVIGDMASVAGPGGTPLPGLAPVAIQQGRYVARRLLAQIEGQAVGPFVYRDRGTMATVGRGAAVMARGRVRLWGFLGWLAWLFVHLLQVTEFENRLLVVTQWAWSYVTRNRSARLIVGTRGDRSRP